MRGMVGRDRFGRCVSGATAIEYGLIASLIAAGLVISLGALGDSVGGAFSAARAALPDTAAARSQPGGGPAPGIGNGKGNNGRGRGNGGSRSGG
jgi:pilus assembly protein Flp/PilA